MFWESIPEESFDVVECASLISNNFTLNSGGRSLAVRRQESRSRIRPNIEPLVLNYDEEEFQASSPEKNNIMAVDDVSFYDNHSPRGGSSPRQYPSSPMINVGLLSPEGSPQRFTVVQNTVTMVDKRRSIDEIDSSSVDSGYGTTSFKFAEPQLLPIKKLEPSPRKNSNDIQLQNLLCNRDNKTPPKSFRLFHSLSSGSMESMDDEYMELFEMENLEDDSHLPSDLNSLISGHIKAVKTTPDIKRPSVRRCLSLTENNSRNQARSALFEPKTPEILKPVQDNNNTPTTITTSTSTTPYSSRHIERCFKRPEPPSISPIQSKRYKTDTDEKENNILRNEKINLTQQIIQRPPLRKSMSMNDAHIMTALARSSSEPDLIGDFSKPFCLPLMPGRHRDLKSISSSTMAKLILGEYRNSVASFKIIDCRYPYEYDGGHIRGAQNLYTHEQILDELVNSKTESQIVQQADGPKRHILVFHCEFSSERGPKLSRFLRSHDRLCNSNKYPALHYPEIYLLHGGYKEFFENYSDLCDPVSYRPMLDPSFGAAYKQFRAKSKSWNGDIKATGTTNRLSKSRSRLVL